MDDVELADWYAGITRDNVEAFRLFDAGLTNVLQVEPSTVVWLSDYTLTKTSFRHAEIEFGDYLKIPEVLEAGFALRSNKKRTVEVVHADLGQTHHQFWRLCLKGTADASVFVTMFHRSHLKDVRRLYRRAKRQGTLLREHKNEPVRLLLSRTGDIS